MKIPIPSPLLPRLFYCSFLSVIACVLAGAAVAARIDSIEPDTVMPNTPVVIHGSGFGTDKGSVTIAGQRAWTTTWSDARVVAYVPSALPHGTARVNLTTAGFATAAGNVSLEAPGPVETTVQGTVAWRFEMLANYVSHRADIGRDGTVYVNDSSGFLYALNPDGSLKWVYDGGGTGSNGPAVVGRDGTIYFGIAGVQTAIHAVNPDGTRKWIFIAPQSLTPFGGPSIGPDGNIFAVFDRPGPYGIVSLNPDGSLKWNNLGNPQIDDYPGYGRELAFGGGNVYWDSQYFGYVYAFDIASGTQRWVINLNTPGQPVATRNGTLLVATGVQPTLNAYTKNGQFRWSFLGHEHTTTNVLSAPDLGRDGNIYIDRNQSELYSLTPAPVTRWIAPSLLPQGPVPGPIVSPAGDVVVIGGQETYGAPGEIQGFSTVDGSLLFDIHIPLESDGTCAVPYARAKFTRSGDRAYLPAVQLCEVPKQYHSWLYAIDITQP